MSIKDQWAQAVEEFGDDAHKRFKYSSFWSDGRFKGESNFISNNEINISINDNDIEIKQKPIRDLVAHDIEVYGDNAYLMWELKRQGMYFDGIRETGEYRGLVGNHEFEYNSAFDLRRKTSAALPFDMERAKAGDVVEYNSLCGWLKLESIPDDYNEFPLFGYTGQGCLEFTDANALRMRYPERKT